MLFVNYLSVLTKLSLPTRVLSLTEDIQDLLTDIVDAVVKRRNWRRFRKELGFSSNDEMQTKLEFSDYEMGRLVFADTYPAFVISDLLKASTEGSLVQVFAKEPRLWHSLIHNAWTLEEKDLEHLDGLLAPLMPPEEDV